MKRAVVLFTLMLCIASMGACKELTVGDVSATTCTEPWRETTNETSATKSQDEEKRPQYEGMEPCNTEEIIEDMSETGFTEARDSGISGDSVFGGGEEE